MFLSTEMEKMYTEIAAQREEILCAFIAKYGLEPDEIEQVCVLTINGFRWYVRKRGTK